MVCDNRKLPSLEKVLKVLDHKVVIMDIRTLEIQGDK